MAPHSAVLAWKIPWTEEPGGLQSIPRRPARAGAPLWPTPLLPCSGRRVSWAGLFRLPHPGREHAAFAVCSPPIPILPGLLRSRTCPTVQVLPQPPVCMLHMSPLLAPRG